MDALAVTVTNTMSHSTLTKRQLASMPILFGLFQGLMPLLGYFFGGFISQYLSLIIPYVTLVIFLVLGLKMIFETYKENRDTQSETIKQFTLSNVTLQAVATSIDAFFVGVSLALTAQGNIFIIVSIITLVTMLVILVGLFLGKIFGKILKSSSGYVGGVILLLIGLKMFLEGVL